jgi:hypothetical protein
VVIAACDLPDLGPSAVTRLIDIVGGDDRSSAAYRVEGRTNWSLVALGVHLVEDFAGMVPADVVGRSLQSLFAGNATLVDPADPRAVTDIDEPPTSS